MDLDDYLSATAPAPAAPASTPAPVADTRWQQVEPLEMLPNGQPLKCTLRRVMIMADVFGAEGPPFPSMLSAVLLYLCAHEAAVWSVPVTTGGETRPLWRAPEALLAAALEWAEPALDSHSPAEVAGLAARLWLYHDETRVTPQKKTGGSGMNPPASSPPSSSSGSGSPPTETPSAPLSSPTISPSATSTPPSTVPSSPAASPA